MKTLIAAVSILAISGAAAFAQTTPSTTDAPAGAGQNPSQEKMSPGTAGAMQNESSGVATSPQDVQKQGTGSTTVKPGGGETGKAGGGDHSTEKPK